jgi:CBS domain-containing protein
VCSGDVVTLSPSDTVGDAVQIMREKAVRRVPVVEGDKPVGIVSIGDLAIERDARSALADISAAEGNT